VLKDNFLGLILEFLKLEGYSEQKIRKALEACWNHGASTAFYFPREAYEEVGDKGRLAYAEYVLGASWLSRWQKLTGEKLSDKDREDLMRQGVKLELVCPYMRIAGGKAVPPDWICGRRSEN